MADTPSVDGDIATGTHSITIAPSSRASSPTTKSHPTSNTDKRKGSGSTTLSDSIVPSFTTSTSIKLVKGVNHPSTTQATNIGSSGAFSAANTIPIQFASSTNAIGDMDIGSGGTLGPGVVTAVVIGTVIVILLPIIILCLRRQRLVNRAQRSRWWKRRRPTSQRYDDNLFSPGTGHSTPTPTPQWATGNHIYRPGDPPIPPEEDEIYSHTLKSKLAVDFEHTRMTCLSAASTASHDSTQRPSPARNAGSQPSLPSLSACTAGSSDPMLPSSLSPPASQRSRTISLRPICLSDYPPIPPLPKSPPPPPPFPRVHRADSYVFVTTDQFDDLSASSS